MVENGGLTLVLTKIGDIINGKNSQMKRKEGEFKNTGKYESKGERENMYLRESKGWFKHYDFILLDLICLQIAFFLAYVLRGMGWNPYSHVLYRNMAIL